MSNTLYLCPDYPIDTNSGGKLAHKNHISSLMSVSGDNLSIIAVGDKSHIDSNKNIFCFGLQDAHSIRFSKVILKFIYFVFSKYPYKIRGRYRVEARKLVTELLSENHIKNIIIDHIDGLALLPIDIISNKQFNIVYIAHNLEAFLLSEISKCYAWYDIRRIMYIVESIKTHNIEKTLLTRANSIIFLSEYDSSCYEKHKYQKTFVQLPPIELPKLTWKYKGTRNIIYSSSPRFAPNREAIKWLTCKLARELYKLDPTINIYITGTSNNDVPHSWLSPNISLLGYIPRQYLDELLTSSDLYICPVVYGSGVKMKILEAVAFKLPVLATKRSWEGLESLLPCDILLDRSDETIAAKQVIDLINSPEKLMALSDECSSKLYNNLSHKIDFSSILNS